MVKPSNIVNYKPLIAKRNYVCPVCGRVFYLNFRLDNENLCSNDEIKNQVFTLRHNNRVIRLDLY